MAKKSSKLPPPLVFAQVEDRREATEFLQGRGFELRFVAQISWLAGQGYEVEVRLENVFASIPHTPVTERAFASVSEALRHVETELAAIQRLYADPALNMVASEGDLEGDGYQISIYCLTTEDANELVYTVSFDTDEEGFCEVATSLARQDEEVPGVLLISETFPDFLAAQAAANTCHAKVADFIGSLRGLFGG